MKFGGASGSFVSPDGLVFTNHHVAFDQIQKLSTPEKDYVRDGFYARTRAEEAPCPDLELRVLVSTADVTARVLAAVDTGASNEIRSAQRRAVIAKIEEESTARAGLKSEVVELYRGGQYWVYRYRTYTDVRLVMAPESRIAAYGGDLDNFTYPRYDLDISFFRIYENGKPLHSDDYLRWSRTGPKDGRVGVRGWASRFDQPSPDAGPTRVRIRPHHPGAHRAPGVASEGLLRLRRAGAGADAAGDRSHQGSGEQPEAPLWIPGSSRETPSFWKRSGRARPKCARAWPPTRNGRPRPPMPGIASRRLANRCTRTTCDAQYRDLYRVSKLVDFANTIVRYTAEVEKPDAERLDEFRGPKLASQRFRLFSRAPVFPDMEEYILGVTLQQMLDALGPDDAFVKAALERPRPGPGGPRSHSTGTRLGDVGARKALIEGGVKAVKASKDPLIVWARSLDAPYRELRTWVEENVENVESTEGRPHRPRALRALRRLALSRRHRHPAVELRQGGGV